MEVRDATVADKLHRNILLVEKKRKESSSEKEKVIRKVSFKFQWNIKTKVLNVEYTCAVKCREFLKRKG